MKYCLKCGYHTTDEIMFCPHCQCALDDQNDEEFGHSMETVCGTDKIDVTKFIEKHQNRYIRVFKKNEHKDIFLSLNWCAAVFGIYWAFYRKLYKEGFLLLIISIIFSSLTLTMMLMAYKGDVAELRQTAAQTSSVYNYVSYNVNNKINGIISKISFYVFLTQITLNLIFGLFADCLYKKFVLKNVKHKNGGVSEMSLLASIIILYYTRFAFAAIQSNLMNVIWGNLI